MFGVCKYYAEDRDEACDFLQEGFITVFRKLEQYQANGSLEGWIRKIIVNTSLQAIRKKKVFNNHFDLIKIEQEELHSEEPEGYDVNPNDLIQWVNELPKKASLVMKLYAIEGYTHKEISEILEISIGTSKSQLNRSRALLKAKMNEQG